MTVDALMLRLQAYPRTDEVRFDVLNATDPFPQIEHVYKPGPGVTVLQAGAPGGEPLPG